MRFYQPELALGVLLPPQREMADKWGGLPWGLPQERWPRCSCCGKPLTHLAQLGHDPNRLDLGASGRVLLVFQCNHDPGGCPTWKPDGGANAVQILEGGELGEGLTRPPAPGAGVEVEARVVRWLEGDDPVPDAELPKVFDNDTFWDLPGEVIDGFEFGTKLGGVPTWVQHPELPPPPYRFAGQFDSQHLFPPPAPTANEAGCTVTRQIGGKYRREEPRMGGGGIVGSLFSRPRPAPAADPQGSPRPRWLSVNEDGTYFCDAANYGDAGVGYLFVDPSPTRPSGLFLWQCH